MEEESSESRLVAERRDGGEAFVDFERGWGEVLGKLAHMLDRIPFWGDEVEGAG